MNQVRLISIVLVFVLTQVVAFTPSNKSFSIDYEHNCFVKDGIPFQYISGSFHYFRALDDKWSGILTKMRLGGLNAVQIYAEWASHQPKAERKYDFSGNLNLLKFIELARDQNLLVILRPGPYIDAERDIGGLPPWLLWKYPNIKLRSSHTGFKQEVSQWFQVLLNMIKPYLYTNGGPIIMIQVENEYGSYSCDMDYKIFLRDLIQSIVGPDVVMFTTDYADKEKLRCGLIPGVYPTVDFGVVSESMVKTHFSAQRHVAPKGPLVNSEFYSGWFDRWGYQHSTVSGMDVATTLDTMLSLGANANIYVYYGGTSFGFHSGSTTDNVTGPGGFQSSVTSYDFDAPLNEAGDPTQKYFQIKEIIAKYRVVPTENPIMTPKLNLGKIYLEPLVSILDEAILEMFGGTPIKSVLPLSFEDLELRAGFVLYETAIQFTHPDPSWLAITNLRDRAYVYIGKELAGVVSRKEEVSSIPIFVERGGKLQILVESQGRPSFGESLNESKGLGVDIRLNSHPLQNWTMHPIAELNTRQFQKFSQKKSKKIRDIVVHRKSAMTFTGTFRVGNRTCSKPLDTFVRLDGWRKGLVWINNFNLGRYWPAIGPQETLYLPSSLLNPFPAKNYIMVLELEKIPNSCLQTLHGCYIQLVDKHVINGTTPASD